MTDEHTQMHENDSLIESFIPTDFTDVGQGTVLYEAYHHKLRYCEGVGWIAYNGGVWEPSETAAHSYSQRLTDLQMQEAKTMGLNNIGMFGQPASMSQTYMEYAVMRRSSAKIAAALREAKPKLSIRAAMLDGDPLIFISDRDGEILVSLHPFFLSGRILRSGEMRLHFTRFLQGFGVGLDRDVLCCPQNIGEAAA